MAKKIILISTSVIFFLASAAGIGWIIKKEIEKGKKEQQQDITNTNKSDLNNDLSKNNNGDINNNNSEEVIVSSKNDANKVLEDMDLIVSSIGNESETK